MNWRLWCEVSCLRSEVREGKWTAVKYWEKLTLGDSFSFTALYYYFHHCICCWMLCMFMFNFVTFCVLCIVFRTGYGASFCVYVPFSVFMSTCCSVIVVGKCVQDYRRQGIGALLDYPNWGFSVIFLSCKANARVLLTKTGHGPQLSIFIYLFFLMHVSLLILCTVYVLFCVPFMCLCVILCTVYVLFCVLFMCILCTLLLPPGVSPFAVY